MERNHFNPIDALSVLHRLHCGLIITGKNTVIEFMNRTFEEMFDLDASEIVGYSAEQAPLHPDLRSILLSTDGRKAGELVTIGLEKRTGQKWWIEIVESALVDSAGNGMGKAILASNVTERKRHQLAIEKERSISKSIIDSSLDMIIACDRERRITEFNKSAEEAFGYRREEVIGEPVVILYGDDGQGELVHHELTHNGHSVKEIVNRRKNGETFHSYLSASVIRDDQGYVSGYMGVSRDISEKLESEKKIRQMAALLEIIPDALIVTNAEGLIQYWSPGARDIFLWTEEAVLGTKLCELFGVNDMDFYEATKMARSSRVWSCETVIKSGSGEPRSCLCRVSLLESEGVPAFFLFVITDITEKKRMDEERCQNQRLESVGRLAGRISHDLNNIFTPVMLNLASLRDEIEDLNQRALIDRISGYLRKGIKLVGRVLKVSNGKSTPLNWEMVNLNQVIKDVRDLVGDIIPTSVEQRFELTNPGCPVWGDSDQLFLVFMNLIVNARDAMPSGGKLNVCVEDVCRENARWVCVKVSDSGIGIPEDKLPRIFEEFFTTKPNGTGFGLATARAIVNEHGGSIHVDSREEFGTTFEVRLPAYCVDFIPDTVEPTTGQSPLVLLVEDEEALCQVFKRMLENAKYNVVTAQDGLEGLKIFSSRTREINVVITDIRMPKMSGINLIEAIRKIDPVCKIVVTTGDGLPEYREQLDRLDVPVQGFLRKPFTQSDLVNTVQNVVSMQ